MRFTALDGLRGLCALFVAAFHFEIVAHISNVPFVINSFLFADFFFVLSGFVISVAYSRRMRTSRSLASYIVRRFGRLYPLHVGVLLVWVVFELGKLYASQRGVVFFLPPFDGPTSVGSLISNLFLVQTFNLQEGPTWNFPSWSISAEFYSYLIFGLLDFCLLRSNLRLRIGVFALCALLGGGLTAALSIHGIDATSDFGIFRCLFGFFIGAITYEVFQVTSGGDSPLTENHGTLIEILVLAGLAAFVSVTTRDQWSFFAPFVFAVATFIFAREHGAISRILGSPAFVSLGHWSYSIYMVHAFIAVNLIGRVVSLVERLENRVLRQDVINPDGTLSRIVDLHNDYLGDFLMVTYLAIVIAISSQTYRFLELPWRGWFNRQARRILPPDPKRLPL